MIGAAGAAGVAAGAGNVGTCAGAACSGGGAGVLSGAGGEATAAAFMGGGGARAKGFLSADGLAPGSAGKVISVTCFAKLTRMGSDGWIATADVSSGLGSGSAVSGRGWLVGSSSHMIQLTNSSSVSSPPNSGRSSSQSGPKISSFLHCSNCGNKGCCLAFSIARSISASSIF